MKIDVYHRSEVFASFGEPLGTSDYEHVAVVNVPLPDPTDMVSKLEYAWRWTNNVCGSWSMKDHWADMIARMPPSEKWKIEALGESLENGDENPNVTVVAPLHEHKGQIYGLRSSSVGDLMLVNGTMYVADSIGFSTIDEFGNEDA